MKEHIIWLTALVIILFSTSLYLNHQTSNVMDDLVHSHQELRWKVAGIEIKWDDMANQLMLDIEYLYSSEIQTAINIAHDADFKDYRKLVLINPSLNIVRLSNIDHQEITVNIETKVVTTYSPQ